MTWNRQKNAYFIWLAISIINQSQIYCHACKEYGRAGISFLHKFTLHIAQQISSLRLLEKFGRRLL